MSLAIFEGLFRIWQNSAKKLTNFTNFFVIELIFIVANEHLKII